MIKKKIKLRMSEKDKKQGNYPSQLAQKQAKRDMGGRPISDNVILEFLDLSNEASERTGKEVLEQIKQDKLVGGSKIG